MKAVIELPVIQRPPVRTPTLALGLVCSIVAVAIALAVQATTSLPMVAVVVVLAAGAFALSWHQCGRPLSADVDDPPN